MRFWYTCKLHMGMASSNGPQVPCLRPPQWWCMNRRCYDDILISFDFMGLAFKTICRVPLLLPFITCLMLGVLCILCIVYRHSIINTSICLWDELLYFMTWHLQIRGCHVIPQESKHLTKRGLSHVGKVFGDSKIYSTWCRIPDLYRGFFEGSLKHPKEITANCPDYWYCIFSKHSLCLFFHTHLAAFRWLASLPQGILTIALAKSWWKIWRNVDVPCCPFLIIPAWRHRRTASLSEVGANAKWKTLR